MRALDQILYEAYCNKADWKSQATGADLPGWNKLPQNIKDCWWAAAEAAIEWAYERDISAEPIPTEEEQNEPHDNR